MRGLLILALSVATCMAKYTSLVWSDCGSDESVSLQNIVVTPMPVVVPGDIQFTLQTAFSMPLGDITMHMDIKNHTFLLDLPAQCLFHVGSYTYESTCASPLLDKMITEGWGQGLMTDLGRQIKTMLNATIPNLSTYSCPYPALNINIQQYTLHLPEVPAVLSWFAAGNYSITVTIKDKATSQQLLCLHLDLTIEEPCSGFGCITG